MSPPEDLLRRIASGDERALLGVESALDRRSRTLVRLAALLALDASTTSLRWAVELAGIAGAGDDEVAATMVATAATVGAAQVVSGAGPLALALDLDPLLAQEPRV